MWGQLRGQLKVYRASATGGRLPAGNSGWNALGFLPYSVCLEPCGAESPIGPSLWLWNAVESLAAVCGPGASQGSRLLEAYETGVGARKEGE